ncbi:MAG: dihydropteroate synthase [Candidatus Eremiobacteraeota bacterium]|nr:dihydropteroate synthase [Candidatus Eremiobacteraeota bacterium]
MLFIGERINGMFKGVRKAIQERDKKAIQELAHEQMEHGAACLDVNVGPAAADAREAMEWLVMTIQEAGEFPLAIDSPKPEVLEAGLRLCRAKPMINSTTADPGKMEVLLALAKKYGASVIGLCMDAKGVPADVDGRVELAATIFATAVQEHGLPPGDVYLDPLILPVNVTQDTPWKVLESIKTIRSLDEPPPHVIIGLSNVSQKCSNRELINRTYLAMAMGAGLDAVICDVLDRDLVNTAVTARILLNRDIYCDSFLEAYRSCAK